MSLSETWQGLCTPAQIYAVLAFITIIGMAYKQQYGPIIMQAIFAALWTFVLGWICTQGWTWVSWVLVLLPAILAVGLIIFIIYSGSNLNDIYNTNEKESKGRTVSVPNSKKVTEYFMEADTEEECTALGGHNWTGTECVASENEHFYGEPRSDQEICVDNGGIWENETCTYPPP